jgi:hypothetical protein
MKNVVMIILLLILVSSIAFAQTKRKKMSQDARIESIVLAKEKQKWEAIRTGQWSSIENLYADDCISIGYAPDLTISRRTKQELFGKAKLGKADFSLSDFKVVISNADTAVVTFKARGTDKTPPGPGFVIYATSVWVKRAGEWKTIFYQASLTK